MTKKKKTATTKSSESDETTTEVEETAEVEAVEEQPKPTKPSIANTSAGMGFCEEEVELDWRGQEVKKEID